jgi:hypothetical protein
MGVDAVLMVENSRQISLELFLYEWEKNSLLNFPKSPDFTSWIEFEWDGKRYFSLTSGTPRYKSLISRFYDFESEIYDDNPDFDPDILIPFLKITLTAEKIAGGPVYLGNDAINLTEPPDDPETNDFFSIPMEIDSMIHDWREMALQIQNRPAWNQADPAKD